MAKKIGPKYVIMNGTSGCIPDNWMFAENLPDAISSTESLFDGLPRGAKKTLRQCGIYYFGKRAAEYGADYVEIAENTETTYADLEAEGL